MSAEHNAADDGATGDDAVVVTPGRADATLLVSCEHATERMPDGYAWPAEDHRLVGTHWAFDLGALDLARRLAEAAGAPLVHSTFSRLVIDPNRPEDSPTLVRAEAEGQPVALNAGLSDEERQRRIERFLRPYHRALDAAIEASGAPTLLSMHSFTPLYEGQPRSLEIGVLFDRDEAPARALAERLSRRWKTELNEPYSGQAGLMYAIDRHARTHERVAIELEVRQDLAVDPEFAAEFTAELAAHFAP